MVGDLGADNDSWLFLGIVYKASARSAARFSIISCTHWNCALYFTYTIYNANQMLIGGAVTM